MKRILIISTNAIGDTYLSMSAIPVIRENFNDCEIYFLITEASRFLFEYRAVDKIVIVEKNISSVLSVTQELRRINFDYVFTFFPGTVNTFFLKTLNSENKSGFYNLLKRNEWFDKKQRGYAKCHRNKANFFWEPSRNFLELIFKPLKHCEIKFDEIRKYIFEIKFKQNDKQIVIHPFSKRQEKSLSINQINLLAKFLKQKYNSKIVIIGDEKINELRNILNNRTELIVKPSLKRLVELVNSRLFIGVDSFPLHVADAYSSSFVGLFSVTSPAAVLTNRENSITFTTNDLRRVPPQRLRNALIDFIEEKKFLS